MKKLVLTIVKFIVLTMTTTEIDDNDNYYDDYKVDNEYSISFRHKWIVKIDIYNHIHNITNQIFCVYLGIIHHFQQLNRRSIASIKYPNVSLMLSQIGHSHYCLTLILMIINIFKPYPNSQKASQVVYQ